MKRGFYILLLHLLFANYLFAQLEGVIVETYYVSDANDATDASGFLEEGSVTYRIYIDMLPGSRLLRLYGTEDHLFEISSTAPFYNNTDRNETFAKDIKVSWLDEGNVALDTWLTIGQSSDDFDTDNALYAVQKEKDTDGSIVGGENNDGGSTQISTGLQTNSDALAGIPLTTADGLVTSTNLPTNWLELITPLGLPTIFNSDQETTFQSDISVLQNSGTSGPIESDNEVIIAQLTTKGELSFQINVEIEFEEDGALKVQKYVASDSLLGADEIFSPLLSYPWTCGCLDPNFLEASLDFACEDNSLCITPVVYGCLDEAACNYDPEANFNVEELCCYVGYCNDRDISVICPELPSRSAGTLERLTNIYPNPARNSIRISLDYEMEEPIPFTIYDAYGRVQITAELRYQNQDFDVTSLSSGVYYVQLLVDNDIVVTKSISIL